MSEPVLEVENLRVDIPVSAGVRHPVRGSSFSVAKGETLCIVGESGCGKSLTSLAMMGLLPKTAIRTADKLNFRGEDILMHSERKMSNLRGGAMSMIFQEPMTSLNPAYTIGNQLMEVYTRHVSRSKSDARDRAVFLLEKGGISSAASRLGQYPHQLSGGLRQRGQGEGARGQRGEARGFQEGLGHLSVVLCRVSFAARASMAQRASSPVSPVRTRRACSTSRTKILPSPIFPVLAVEAMVSTVFSTAPSGTTISSLILGTKFTTYSAPR